MRHLAGSVVVGLWLASMAGGVVFAQDADPVYPAATALSPDQIDQLVGPIALYPDPLIAEITAAATFPDQIVVADRDLGQGMTADDVAQQGLDSSVSAIAHYPTLLKWMDDNLQWTTQLGQAFASQQSDVMDAVQRMRAKAQSLGNLPTTPQETVEDDGGDIEIEPTDPDEIYVPEYNPDAIYYDPGIYCSFGIGLPIGIWWGHDWDWGHHEVIAWDAGHPRPHDWWTRPPSQRRNFPAAHVWHPTAGRVVGYGGDRGYARPFAPARPAVKVPPFHSATAPIITGARVVGPRPAPRPEPAPRAEPTRTILAPREPAPEVTPREPAPEIERVNPAPAPREARGSDEGMFGGGGTVRSTESFSSRGAESRGVSTPVSQVSRGGGGGGGGGGARGGSPRH